MAKLTKQETIDMLNSGYLIVKAHNRMYGTYYYLTNGIKDVCNLNLTHIKSIVSISKKVDFIMDKTTTKNIYSLT